MLSRELLTKKVTYQHFKHFNADIALCLHKNLFLCTVKHFGVKH